MGSEFLWGFHVTLKGFGVGVAMGFCCPKCGVGVPKCPHLGWGPYGVLMPHRKGCGVGGLYGVLQPYRKGFGVKVPMGFWCPIGRDLGSGGSMGV